LVEGMSTSFDRAESARSDMTESYQKAQSYREVAAHAEENAVSINANASQVFQEWLLSQPSTRGEGKMSLDEAENIVRHQPQLAASYAEKFSHQYVEQMLSRSDRPLSHSAQSLKASYQSQNQKIKGESTIAFNYQSNHETISHTAMQSNISSMTTSMDKSVKGEVDAFIVDHNKQATHSEPIDSAGQKITKEVKNHDKKR